MVLLAEALQVVLPAGKVPHEVAPVHKVELVGEEELQVLYLRGHLDRGGLARRVVVGHLLAFYAAHPALVCARMIGVPHTGEEHVLSVEVFVVMTYYYVFVLLVLAFLLLTIVDRFALLGLPGEHTVACGLILRARGVGLTVKERPAAILLAVEVGTEGKDVFGGVLVHRRVGHGAYHDDGVG